MTQNDEHLYEADVRWMSLKKDGDQILDIEHRCKRENAWALSEFRKRWKQSMFLGYMTHMGIVVEIEGMIVGFAVYYFNKLVPETLCIVNLCVHPEWRRLGVGTLLLDQIKKKAHRRRECVYVCAEVSDKLYDMHKLFGSCEFYATPSEYDRSHYHFNWRNPCESKDKYRDFRTSRRDS